MTPAAILALVRDAVIVGALAFIGFFLVKAGEDRVTAKQLAGLEQRIQDNANTEAGWRNQKDAADTKLAGDLATINRSPAQPKPAVWVCKQPPAAAVGAVPGAAVKAGDQPAGAGGGEQVGGQRGGGEATGPGPVNVRPLVDEAERRIETALAEARDLRDQYPQVPPHK